MIQPTDKTKTLPDAQDLVGKTIKSIDNKSCNVVLIDFTDGTQIMLEAVYINPLIGIEIRTKADG